MKNSIYFMGQFLLLEINVLCVIAVGASKGILNLIAIGFICGLAAAEIVNIYQGREKN